MPSGRECSQLLPSCSLIPPPQPGTAAGLGGRGLSEERALTQLLLSQEGLCVLWVWPRELSLSLLPPPPPLPECSALEVPLLPPSSHNGAVSCPGEVGDGTLTILSREILSLSPATFGGAESVPEHLLASLLYSGPAFGVRHLPCFQMRSSVPFPQGPAQHTPVYGGPPEPACRGGAVWSRGPMGRVSVLQPASWAVGRMFAERRVGGLRMLSRGPIVRLSAPGGGGCKAHHFLS